MSCSRLAAVEAGDAPPAPLPEGRWNSLLRRVDWRLLLADPAPRTSACSADQHLADALALVSGRVVGPEACPPGGCDLAVAQDPDGAALRSAFAALRPGGSGYAEWRLPVPAGAARRIRGRMEAAGFDAVACYAPWPSASRARFWLPLEAPGALRYLRTTLSPGADAAGRWRRLIHRAAWLATGWVGLAPTICAIGRRPATPAGTGPWPDRSLLGRVREGWRRWGLGAPTPERLSCLLLTGGPRSTSKCVALIFAEPDPCPRLVVKLPRTEEAAAGLAREAAVLDVIHARRPGGVPGAPRLLFREPWGEAGMVLGQTALPGRPLRDRLRRGTARALAGQVTDWLADLAVLAGSGRPSDARRRILEPALTRFEACFGAATDTALLRRARAMLDQVPDLPAVPEQRDCSPWNLLLAPDGTLVVLDWESAEPDGIPGFDLAYFLAFIALHLDRVPLGAASPALRRSCRATLDPSTPCGAIRAECLARYARRLGLDAAALAPLLPFAWMVHAWSEHRRLVADRGGPPGPEALRGSVFLALWEEEMRHAGQVEGQAPAADRQPGRPASERLR